MSAGAASCKDERDHDWYRKIPSSTEATSVVPSPIAILSLADNRTENISNARSNRYKFPDRIQDGLPVDSVA